MTGEALPLVLLPGLGADGQLFDPQRARFPGLVVPSWIGPGPRESLADYARRLGEGFPQKRPEYIGGASFGGMLALEVAKRLRPRAVFLLGSCRSPAAIRPAWKLGGALLRRFPATVFGLARSQASALAWALGPCSREVYETVTAMHQAIAPEFLRWGLGAMLDWEGVEDPGVPVHHLHGSRDRLLPLSRVRPDRVLPGAGHLLTLTHGAAVNDYLEEKMSASR